MTSVTLAMPNMGSVKTFTMVSILEILANAQIPVTIARRDCVLEAQKAGSSHIFFLDSDMMVHGDVIHRLAEHNKAVIGVHYNERNLPLVSTIKMKNREAWTGELPKHIFQCHAVATGCMLIDMQVFEKINKQWFFYEHDENGQIMTGEDMWFCERAAEAGYGIWCDPTIPVKHIGDFGY